MKLHGEELVLCRWPVPACRGCSQITADRNGLLAFGSWSAGTLACVVGLCSLRLRSFSCYSFPMVVTVNIPDELAAEAKARGLSLEAYVQELLAQQLAVIPAQTRQPRTPEDIRAWLDSLAPLSDTIPPLP